MSCAIIEQPSAIQWPAEVDLILSAMETGEYLSTDRRRGHRKPFRSLAHLCLFSEPTYSEPRVLYTRDACSRGLGFITPSRVPLSCGGTLELAMPDGQLLSIDCTVQRCRHASRGWYEGSLSFSREQPLLRAGSPREWVGHR